MEWDLGFFKKVNFTLMKKRIRIQFMRLAFCLVASWLTFGFLIAQPQNELGTPFIKNYSPKEYKGFPQIFGVTQDTSGIIYFTGNGITEYDGETWRRIPPLGVVTWSIVLGEDGKIYVGGTDDLGYLEHDSLGQQQFISLKSLVPEKDREFSQLRHAIVVGDDVYFASKTGYLIKYDSKEKSIRTWKRESPFTLLGHVYGELYIDVRESGLHKIVGEEIQIVPDGEFFKEKFLTKILPFQKDQLIFCTKNDGLFTYQNNTFIPFLTEADELLNSWIYTAEMLPDSSYVFSIINQGIIIIDQKGKWKHHLNKSNGLLDDIIISIHCSPSGTLWVGANTGLSQLEIQSPFSNFIVDEYNKPLFVEDIIRFENKLYAASSSMNGFLYLDEKSQIFRNIKNNPLGQAFSFSIISNQLHGVGTKGNYKISKNTTSLYFKNTIPGISTSCEHESKLKKGFLFQGHQKGLSTIFEKNNSWISQGKIKEIPANVGIKSFLENESGQLWIGTENHGLWRMDYQIDDSYKITIQDVVTYSQGLEQLDLKHTSVYLINNIPTFSGVGGIFNYDETTNKLVPDLRFPLPVSSEKIQKITLAKGGDGKVYTHFYFFDGTADLGVYIPQADGNYIFDASLFQSLPKDELLNVSKLYPEPNGVIWIAAQDRIFRFDGAKNNPPTTFSVKIRTVHIGEDSLLYSGHGVSDSPVLEYAQNDIRFHYLAINLNINGKNKYQTKLEGFDDTWSDWNFKTERVYTNVPEGNYTFKVRGKSPAGISGTESNYIFKITPPWWRTWWAYLSYVFLGVGTLSVFSRWRNRRLRQQREHLQQTVKERTKEIEQRVEELSAINNLQEGLVALMDINEIYQLVGDKIQELFKANIAYIAIADKEEELIRFPYGYGDNFSDMKLGEGLTSKILSAGKPILINKEANEAHHKLGIEKIGKQAASFLGVPILLGKEVVGVMSVQSTTQTNRFGKTDETLLNTIASQVGIALYNAQLFNEAEKARAAAEEASEAKSTFLSTVSHELRTPLTSVIGFAKIIKKRLSEGILPFVQTEEKKTHRAIRQVNQNLDVVISEGERLTTLINTVLDLAKIEAGRLDWNMESTPIEGIIKQAAAATSSLFEQKSLPINLEIEEDLPLLNADKDRLVQVVINLISNAVKFTDDGEVRIKAFRQNGSIVVGVKDSGIGISQEDLPKVFEKFKQVGDTLTDKPKGTGLGLPICKEIIEHHKGDIWVESEFGHGSTFMFSIPLNQEEVIDEKTLKEPIKKTSKSIVETWKPKDKTILVVDDEPSIRSLLRQEISEVGYQIKEAVNGKEALKSIRQENPDLVVLDVMMPEMNGFDVAAILKNDPGTQDIPIIIVSIVDDQQRFNRLGIDRYLTKPIDIGLLLKEIDTLIK
jgi:signal transduction histidine kinase/CheY-like chemotaxis protein